MNEWIFFFLTLHSQVAICSPTKPLWDPVMCFPHDGDLMKGNLCRLQLHSVTSTNQRGRKASEHRDQRAASHATLPPPPQPSRAYQIIPEVGSCASVTVVTHLYVHRTQLMLIHHIIYEKNINFMDEICSSSQPFCNRSTALVKRNCIDEHDVHQVEHGACCSCQLNFLPGIFFFYLNTEKTRFWYWGLIIRFSLKGFG